MYVKDFCRIIENIFSFQTICFVLINFKIGRMIPQLYSDYIHILLSPFSGYFSIIAALRATGQQDIAAILEETDISNPERLSRKRQSKKISL